MLIQNSPNLKFGSIFHGILFPCCVNNFPCRGSDISDAIVGGSPVDKKKKAACSEVLDALIFNPEIIQESREIVISPATYRLPFEYLYITTKDGIKLMAFLILQKKEYNKVPTMIYLHGNSGNVGDRLQSVQRLYRKMKCNFLLIEYRGFGFSQGRATEKGSYLDAQAAVDYVDSRHDLDSSKIVVFGKSLGGAIAIDLATREGYKNRIAVFIIENTFSSLSELAKHILPPFLIPLIKLLRLKRKFPSYAKVSKITRPTLFISGLNDTFVPPVHMTELYMHCKARKKIVRFYEGDHLNVWRIAGYSGALSDFIADSILKHPVRKTLTAEEKRIITSHQNFQ